MDFVDAFSKLNIASYIFLGLFALASVAQLVLAFLEKEKYRRIEKPLCLFSLGMFALVSFPTQPFIYLGAFFGMIGDILVVAKDKKYFALGALSFFLGHICYALEVIIVILNCSLNYKYYIILAACLVFIFMVMLVPAFRFVKKTWERFGMSLYYATLFDVLPLIVICYFLHGSFSYLCLIGICFFIVSDLIILYTKYVRKFKKYDFYIMSTYLVAQLFLVFGLTMMVVAL